MARLNKRQQSREPSAGGEATTFNSILLLQSHPLSPYISRMSAFLSRRAAPQNSPSVTMEKGAYRIRRGPLLRNPEDITFPSTKHGPRLENVSAPGPSPRTESQAMSASLISQEKRLVLLVMLLVFGTFCCFGTAYYLFTTSRWASSFLLEWVPCPGLFADESRIAPRYQDDTLNSVHMSNICFFRPPFPTSTPSSQPDLPRTHQPNSQQVQPDEKFLSYLPHSGFHNQRIALENALVLARLLNRTLLVPPARFGRRAVPYRNFTVLQHTLDADYMAYLCHLSSNQSGRNDTPAAQRLLGELPDVPGRCAVKRRRKPVTHVYLPWGSITDFDLISKMQPIIQTHGSTNFWIATRLELRVDDILVIPDASKYQFRFTDEIILDPSSDQRAFTNSTYSEDVPISSLVNHPAKLVQLGSLFGSRRLKLFDPSNKAIRRQIRRHMAMKHTLLRKLSTDITLRVSGSGFLGAHLRCNDGYFLDTAMEHSRMLWWKLVHGILGLSIERTRQLELDYGIAGNSSWSLQFKHYTSPSNYPVHRPLDHRLTDNIDSAKCRGELYTNLDLERLNAPLFIATDSKDPYTDEHLRLFRQTFPCLFFLSDFPREMEATTAIRDPIGGMEIGNMLVPFLDAMVVAEAARVVGTPHSTFSWYVQDMLWRVNHGLDIEERNGS